MYSGCIYLATNQTNGAKYVGQTNDFSRRQKEHKYRTKNDKFHNAIQYYGFDSFKWDILQVFCCSTAELLRTKLDEAEMRYIKLFDTYSNGYNLTLGGGGNKGQIHTIESRNKMSAKQRGRIISDETKDKLRLVRLGSVQSKESRQKVSKRIIQTDLNNVYIKTWDSSMDAEREDKFDHSAIIRCCKGKQNYHKNFKFKYE